MYILSEPHKYRSPIAFRKSKSQLFFLDKWIYWHALRKFPTLKYYLKKSDQKNLDVNQFDWTSIRTEAQTQVCFHHNFVALGEPKKVAEWFQAAGFEARLSNSSSFASKVVFMRWNEKIRGSYYPFSRVSVWWYVQHHPLVRGGVLITLDFDDDDHLVRQSIGFGSKLN